MCECELLCAHDEDSPGESGASGNPSESAASPSRRRLLGAIAASASAAVLAGPTLGAQTAYAASAAGAADKAASAGAADDDSSAAPLSITLLGTNGGPPPLAARFGISTALVVNGKTYVIDCGRGAVSQYMRAGLSMPSLAGIFLTHLHADHVVDYFSFPLLSAGASGADGFQSPIGVYGPGSAGTNSTLADAPGPLPGTAAMTVLANQAYAASTNFFIDEKFGIDPTTMLDVHEVMPPADVAAGATNQAPTMQPFAVMEDENVKVSAILVPHGAVYPAFAYRFDTEHGSVVFSGDTSRTPNIPTLARGADVLVHEAADFSVLPSLGLPAALITHIETVHTDVAVLGEIAAEAGVGRLVATHLSPGDPAEVSDAAWRRLLRTSAQQADYGGQMVLGQDLPRIPVTGR